MNRLVKFVKFMVSFYPKLSELLFMLTLVQCKHHDTFRQFFKQGFVPFIRTKMATNIKK